VRRRRGQAAIACALCGAGLALFNFPMLIIWDRAATVFGLPLLPVALFAIWAALIAALAWLGERRDDGAGQGSVDAEDAGGG
jgi:hypothetical protein